MIAGAEVKVAIHVVSVCMLSLLPNLVRCTVWPTVVTMVTFAVVTTRMRVAKNQVMAQILSTRPCLPRVESSLLGVT